MTRDLAALVQALRVTNVRAMLECGTGPTMVSILAHHTDPASLKRSAVLCREHGSTEALTCAREYEEIAQELAAGPRVPGERELVERFHAGELGDRTVRILADLDPWEFFDLCARHGQLPIQEDEQ